MPIQTSRATHSWHLVQRRACVPSPSTTESSWRTKGRRCESMAMHAFHVHIAERPLGATEARRDLERHSPVPPANVRLTLELSLALGRLIWQHRRAGVGHLPDEHVVSVPENHFAVPLLVIPASSVEDVLETRTEYTLLPPSCPPSYFFSHA